MLSRTLLLATALLALSLAVVPPLAAATARRPNVLFIISDDLRNDLGAYGHPLAQTPNLDRLAAAGVRFDRGYCQYPLCNPSRTSMLHGRYPTTTGVLGNRTWIGTAHPDLVSLPKYFRQQGYTTLRAGKIFHGGIDDASAWSEGGESRRFGEGAAPAAPPAGDPDAGDRRPGDAQLTQAQRSDRWLVLEGRGERAGDSRVAERTIEYLRARQGDSEPWFIACGFSKPHSPLEAPQWCYDLYPLESIALPENFAPRPTVPEGFPRASIRPRNADLFIGRDATPEAAKDMIRAYLASVSFMDWNAGRVLDELDRLGLRENTIVVFWGDHGYQLGERGKWSKAGSLFEQGTRVPILIHAPQAPGNGRSSPRVVEAIDFYPTLVALCGLPEPAGLDGRSLAPLLDDPTRAWDHPAFTVWSENGTTLHGVSVRTEQWHYVEFFDGTALLFDPRRDPQELNNLADDPAHATVRAELSQRVKTFAPHLRVAAPAGGGAG